MNKTRDGERNPTDELIELFVEEVQKGRIAAGQCPARRPVFLKQHGTALAELRVLSDLPAELQVGLFQPGQTYQAWVRFSSDTTPTRHDWKTTVGVGLKLFHAPGPNAMGDPHSGTSDFIFQNMDVFFVDTAADMAEFTYAGVIEHDYDSYLKDHPKTQKILEEMEQPVSSLLATNYWAILPFCLGEGRHVKYQLKPKLELPPLEERPEDPTYLSKDLEKRLAAEPAQFTLYLQERTDPEGMPLDAATERWESPFVEVAELLLPQQDITQRGQEEYGENLSFNIGRVPPEHAPAKESSLAMARQEVYAASASERHDANGVPDGEPARPRPLREKGVCRDERIVRAAIHPAIGIARVGDSEEEFFLGPEVLRPERREPGFYRDEQHALKRQAVRFRLYGYNAAGEVVRELTCEDADIEWTVEVANRKASWYRFHTAPDLQETQSLQVPRRNKKVSGAERATLELTPAPSSIRGVKQSGEELLGEFKGESVSLGQLHTDEAGRLLFLSGRGRAESPSGAPPFDPHDKDTFNNADDWFDDIADGPVDAKLSIEGQPIPVEGAWVVVAPPNYAPEITGWRTLYDLLVDSYIAAGWLAVPETTSFQRDVLPALTRLPGLQWVNQGFMIFGKGQLYDLTNLETLERLGAAPSGGVDPNRQLREGVFAMFRPPNSSLNQPRLWPWLYGDTYDGTVEASSPHTMLESPQLLWLHLTRWAQGEFIGDWQAGSVEPTQIEDVPLADQPTTLDRAALDACLADAFHPGCELTWPMRHVSLFESPFRVRRRNTPEPDYGPLLGHAQLESLDGPLYAQPPGGLTRWMGLPWQGDTAYCRSGYEPDFDPYLPAYWPARVPNHVLSEEDYAIVMDESRPREERLASYQRRGSWYRFVDFTPPNVAETMKRMVQSFGAQGLIEARPGVQGDPDIPEVIWVENLPPAPVLAAFSAVSAFDGLAEPTSLEETRLRQAGWPSQEHLEVARWLRSR